MFLSRHFRNGKSTFLKSNSLMLVALPLKGNYLSRALYTLFFPNQGFSMPAEILHIPQLDHRAFSVLPKSARHKVLIHNMQ